MRLATARHSRDCLTDISVNNQYYKKADSARSHHPAYCIFGFSFTQPNGGAELRNFPCNKKDVLS